VRRTRGVPRLTLLRRSQLLPAFNAANTRCALAKSWATCAATSGNCLGLTIDGAAGQVILTAGGMSSGSISSTFGWSWLTWADAKGVMGEDWDTTDFSSVEGPFRSFPLLAGPTYVDVVKTCLITRPTNGPLSPALDALWHSALVVAPRRCRASRPGFSRAE
jgi:hypothetical protein